jgi:hypothetical protein
MTMVRRVDCVMGSANSSKPCAEGNKRNWIRLRTTSLRAVVLLLRKKKRRRRRDKGNLRNQSKAGRRLGHAGFGAHEDRRRF